MVIWPTATWILVICGSTASTWLELLERMGRPGSRRTPSLIHFDVSKLIDGMAVLLSGQIFISYIRIMMGMLSLLHAYLCICKHMISDRSDGIM